MHEEGLSLKIPAVSKSDGSCTHGPPLSSTEQLSTMFYSWFFSLADVSSRRGARTTKTAEQGHPLFHCCFSKLGLSVCLSVRTVRSIGTQPQVQPRTCRGVHQRDILVQTGAGWSIMTIERKGKRKEKKSNPEKAVPYLAARMKRAR